MLSCKALRKSYTDIQRFLGGMVVLVLEDTRHVFQLLPVFVETLTNKKALLILVWY